MIQEKGKRDNRGCSNCITTKKKGKGRNNDVKDVKNEKRR